MGRSWFLKLLPLSLLILILSFSQGFGRKLMENVELEGPTGQLEGIADTSREMIEKMDYEEPGPNTNPRTGYIFCPPPQTQLVH